MTQAQTSYLNVESSILGRRWVSRASDERLSLMLAQRLDMPEVLTRILVSRGLVETQDISDFLDPKLKSSLPNPSSLKDMDQAVERVILAIEKGENIVLFGDYDVDGATSSSLLKCFFETLNIPVSVYIPDRMKEGYGPSVAAFEKLKSEKTNLIITLDCGTTAFEPLEYASTNGMDIIVLDHHISETRLPKAHALVNPNRIDETPEITKKLGNLAAVGVAFLFLVGLNRELRARGFYGARLLEPPDLISYLDVVALGTICDVVPLVGLNRAFVTQGLKVMGQRRNLGLSILSDVAGIDARPEAYHAGFILGPRINAGGRVGEASLGTRLLTTQDPLEARRISENLHLLNQERQEIEHLVLEEAVAQVEMELLARELPNVIICAGEGWHPGVIGIVAGRLKERYDRPTCIIALENGIGKASARSVPGVNLGSLIQQAKTHGFLMQGGGHAMAAGFMLKFDQIINLKIFLNEKVYQVFKEINYKPTTTVEGSLSARALTVELLENLERLSPYGMGNPTPRFVLPFMRVVDVKVVGKNHLKCILKGEDQKRVEAIAFRAAETPLGVALSTTQAALLHLVGTFRLDEWQGRKRIQMTLEDAAFPS